VTILRKLATLMPALVFIFLAACGAPPGVTASGDAGAIAELTRSILDLGPEVDPEEAARAARIAYEYTSQLAIEYEITDPALIHNMKVNAGLRPRGLCWHWAEDMEKRLRQENFQTLDLHRAIANADDPIFIDHSTAIVSRRGDAFTQGIVLDPWRYGGVLFWSPILEDTRYDWVQREVVLAERQRRALAKSRRVKANATAIP
jgi:hypothetical protein